MTNNIIDTQKINSELKIYQRCRDNPQEFDMYNLSEFVESVRHWKNILGEQSNICSGSKVGAGMELLDIRYASLLYAVSELGGINLVLDKVPVGSVKKPRCRVLAPFDLYIINSSAAQSVINVGNLYANNTISADIWFDYSSTQNHRYANLSIPDSNSIFMQSPTSGSTGEPKAISYTHGWVSALNEHCALTLNYKHTDRVLHLSNLHHGGTSCLFFFPTMRYCREHYFEHGLDANPTKQKEIAELIVKKQINKIMFPNSLLLDQVLKIMPTVDHECYFYSLQANHKSWVAESRRTGINIVSIFGSTETLGPVFINTIAPDTTDDHSVLNYGHPLSSFYSVEIRDQQLHVTDIVGRSNIINDQFTIDSQGNYHYNSRSDLIRINEVTFEFSELHQILVNTFSELTAALIADSTTNKIYLLVSSELQHLASTAEKITQIDHALNKVNPILKIDYVDYAELDQFLTAIKLDRLAIINYFRIKFGLI